MLRERFLTSARPSLYGVGTVTMAFSYIYHQTRRRRRRVGAGEVARCGLNTIVGMETRHSTWAMLCENLFFLANERSSAGRSFKGNNTFSSCSMDIAETAATPLLYILYTGSMNTVWQHAPFKLPLRMEGFNTRALKLKLASV